MSPKIATIVFATGIMGLFYLERQRKTRVSPAVWIAVAWLVLGSSRMVSQWFSTRSVFDSADQYLEGNPTDRLIVTGLLISAILVLISRSRRSVALIKANVPVLIFFGFCVASIVWSDFPLVAFKRWTKGVGNFIMVLLVLTDKDPVAAVKRLFAWTGFLLIPISIMFIKYYPDLGRGYNSFTWTTYYCGVSTDKNGLGALCFILGLTSFWRVLEAIRDQKLEGRIRVLTAHGAVLGMTCWLLMMAQSSTSLACFVIGSSVILITTFSRRSRTVHIIAACIGCVALLSYVFNDAYVGLVSALGRDPTLTGRTEIWNDLFRMNFNRWLGTGYESFWLGPRLEYFWNRYIFHPNEAHNGYIEIYITLGICGLCLLAAQFISGYRNAVLSLRRNIPFASLQIAFIAVAAIYNMTEAAFKVMHPLWVSFLFSIAANPFLVRAKQQALVQPASPSTVDSVSAESTGTAPEVAYALMNGFTSH